VYSSVKVPKVEDNMQNHKPTIFSAADELRDVSLPALAIISLPVLFDTSLLLYVDFLYKYLFSK
jgi:hypothetical protein